MTIPTNDRAFSQLEIDALLSGVGNVPTVVKNMDDFMDYLENRRFYGEKPYGAHDFTSQVSVLRFSATQNGENILADIEAKNEAEGMGNITITGTNIRLINFSYCPQCKSIFSYKEVVEYYKNPVPDPSFASMHDQYRQDTRVRCSHCGTYFLPALVIEDGTPKNETQFLCRVQTVHVIENFYMKKHGRPVLTRKKQNHITAHNKWAFLNDVAINDMLEKPTLITNLLQYTPPNLMQNIIEGKNVEKCDILYGEWRHKR
jgi:hypothetical protein